MARRIEIVEGVCRVCHQEGPVFVMRYGFEDYQEVPFGTMSEAFSTCRSCIDAEPMLKEILRNFIAVDSLAV